jgi:hypothetical protein
MSNYEVRVVRGKNVNQNDPGYGDDQYIGRIGDLFYDPLMPTNGLRVSDGQTRGGTLLSSGGSSSIGNAFSTGINQLTVANDANKLLRITGGVLVLRLPQMTENMLGVEFEFYFVVDAGQVHIQSYYTGATGTTDVFRGSIFVGVDNANTGKLHTATSQTSTACDLFLGQHHAKTGSYVKVKAIDFDGVGVWMFQGTCVGDTGQTPNGSDHPFQDYNA